MIRFSSARGGGIQAGESATDPAVAERLQVINVFNPVYGQFTLPAPGPLTDRVDTESSLGFYIQDQIAITDQLDVRIGFRYDEFSQERLNRLNCSERDNSDSQVRPQLGAVYLINCETDIYASYGRLPALGREPNGDSIDPNITESFEVGIKFGLLNGALEGTAAIFNITQDNILAVTPAFEPTAVGEAESSGFEFDLTGAVTDSLDVWLSYAYVSAETEKDFADPNFGVTIPSGTELVNVPDTNYRCSSTVSKAGPTIKVGGITHGERSVSLAIILARVTLTCQVIQRFAHYGLPDQ